MKRSLKTYKNVTWYFEEKLTVFLVVLVFVFTSSLVHVGSGANEDRTTTIFDKTAGG